jgi:hypothetical protein
VNGHRAHIRWTDDILRRGLPDVSRYVHPARFTSEPPPWKDDTWSLVCEFDESPRKQGNPSAAKVQFLMDGAPHHRLTIGARLHLFDGPLESAIVEVLD